MNRLSRNITAVVHIASRGFSAEAAAAASAPTSEIPVEFGFRHRKDRLPMPTTRGESWGQVLVKNSQLPVPTGVWTPESRRSGILFTKAGMTRITDQHGLQHVVTVLNIDDCQVIRLDGLVNRHNTQRMQIGCHNQKVKQTTKPMLGHFHKARVNPKIFLKDTKVTPDAALPAGWRFDVRHFVIGQYIDVMGTTRGKGFAGVMKRWGFAGQPASHGVSVSHRSLGSTGQCQDPGRVFKNKKMPGRMGGKYVELQNSRVMQLVPRHNVMLVKGQVPGANGSVVYVRDARKHPFNPESPPPFPTFLPAKGDKREDVIMPIELLGTDPYANGEVV